MCLVLFSWSFDFFLFFFFVYFFFFFLMIRRPPRSTLFPYTRSSDLWWVMSFAFAIAVASGGVGSVVLRSEEHTSELQSLTILVCRLLLEKKKKKTIRSAVEDYKDEQNVFQGYQSRLSTLRPAGQPDS